MMTKNLALAASIAMLAAISGLASARAGRTVHPGFARSDRPLGPASATCHQCFLFGDGVGRPLTRTGQNQHQTEEDGSLNRSGHRQAAAVGAMARVIPAIRARAQVRRPIACPPVHAGLF
jgi:hypothetical protein